MNVDKSDHEEDCIFCEISKGAAPCHKVWESTTHLAFLSIYPNTKGLTVVIPKVHRDSYVFNQTEEDILALMLAARAVSALLVAKLSGVGRTALIFEGYGVDHLHAKLIPLHGTEGLWRQIRSNISTTYEIYPGYVSSHDAERAPEENLRSLARFLRRD